MSTYYNEINPHAAEWLRNLMALGMIPDGVVDTRSIEDVRPDELAEFTQCHFFAGIGVWAYALRQAGWPDDRPVWTGSCPCQPFSAAGQGKGAADERHLWPAWFHLIQQCGPVAVYGEQVASKDGLGWFDTVQADLEGAGYAVGGFDLCAAGFGAPHVRQRLYLHARRLGDTSDDRPQRWISGGTDPERKVVNGSVGRDSPADHRVPNSGFWDGADWLGCKDGKFRPVEPGTFPLVDGTAFRVDSGSTFAGKSRAKMIAGAGNAIVAPQATAFIKTTMEVSQSFKKELIQ